MLFFFFVLTIEFTGWEREGGGRGACGSVCVCLSTSVCDSFKTDECEIANVRHYCVYVCSLKCLFLSIFI